DFNSVSIVEPNIIALKWLGFWRSSNSDSFFNSKWYNTYTIVMLFFQTMFIVTGFWYLYDKRQNLNIEDINSVMFIYSANTINVVMMVNIYFNIDMIHFIQSNMQAAAFQPKTSAEAAESKKWKNTARMFQKVFFINNSICAVMSLFISLLNGNKLVLAAHVFPGLNWKVFFIYQVVMNTAGAQMCATYVTLVTSLLIEIIIQFCLLERSLQEMEDYEDLKTCIQWHLDILVFIKKVQRFCGIGVSAVFACGVFNICTSLALVIEVDHSELLFLLPYLLAMVAIIYCHSWCGSEVTYQSDKLSYAIFSSKWIDSDTAYKKLIHIYILLTKQPLVIRLGGGTFDASLPVFVTVINFLNDNQNRIFSVHAPTEV
ncbi:unnamed protein product, partial [Callosobruchus maculatus]